MLPLATRVLSHVGVLCLMAFAIGQLRAETLTLRGDGNATLTITSASGDRWTCSAPSVVIDATFNARTVRSASVNGANCTQVVSTPAPSAGSVRFSSASYVASVAVGRTFITVTRTGDAKGALRVTWRATGTVSPQSGELSWADGEAGSKFFSLWIIAPGTSTLTVGGSTATLTVNR